MHEGMPFYIPSAAVPLDKVPPAAMLICKWSGSQNSSWSEEAWFRHFDIVIGSERKQWLREGGFEMWVAYIAVPSRLDIEYLIFSMLSPEEKTEYCLRFVGATG